MTATDTTGVERTAARAALAVPGVAELQPTLRQSLAGAATRVQQALGSLAPLPEAGIRAERGARTGAWHVEVRCVCNENRRALDTARDIHDNVRAAVESHVTRHGVPGLVTIVVTVTRITGPRPTLQPETTAPGRGLPTTR
ncbi:hypothetical protein OHB14_35135 [Streptomyces sp. NBC_01613]|uniref:hypothetical protein n=1 Tax=Streptomyces sp. NBC_01613 TaxID=2975896 RepID=UPI0038646363